MKQDEDDFALLKYLNGLVEHLRKLTSRAIRGSDVEAVHQARVATRRLKAATEVLGPVVSSHCRKPFEKVTRRLRRQLGPMRDLDVMIGHIGEMRGRKFEKARGWLKDRLTECRAAAGRAAQKKAPPARMMARLGSWWGLQHEISDAREQVSGLLSDSVRRQLDAFSIQATDLAKHDPHELRITGKLLRYMLELAREHGQPLPGAVLSQFKRMQESLGIWHDYVVLSERMLGEAVECDLALHDPLLMEQLLGLAQATLRKAQTHLKKMEQAWGTQGEELCRRIRGVFGEVTAVADQVTPKTEEVVANPAEIVVPIPNAPAA